jgi:hypothetical protein
MSYSASAIAINKREAARVRAALLQHGRNALMADTVSEGLFNLMSMTASNGHPAVAGTPGDGWCVMRTFGLSFNTGVELEIEWPAGKDEAAKGIMQDLLAGTIEDPSTHWKLKPGRQVWAARFGCLYEVKAAEADSPNWALFRRYQDFDTSTITLGCVNEPHPILVKPENVSLVCLACGAASHPHEARDRSPEVLEIIRPCDGGFNSAFNMLMCAKEVKDHLDSLPQEERQPLVHMWMTCGQPCTALTRVGWELANATTAHAQTLGWDGVKAMDAGGNVVDDIGSAVTDYGEQMLKQLQG